MCHLWCLYRCSWQHGNTLITPQNWTNNLFIVTHSKLLLRSDFTNSFITLRTEAFHFLCTGNSPDFISAELGDNTFIKGFLFIVVVHDFLERLTVKVFPGQMIIKLNKIKSSLPGIILKIWFLETITRFTFPIVEYCFVFS